jgi:hypothetical protein
MALPLGLLAKAVLDSRFKWLGWAVGIALTWLNLFQLWQYNTGILHFNDNNKAYYQAIFLKAHPSPLDMSLLDTDEMIADESKFEVVNTIRLDSTYEINVANRAKTVLLDRDLPALEGRDANREQWLKISTSVQSGWGAYESNLITQVTSGQQLKQTKCRLQNALCKGMTWCPIEYYFRLPQNGPDGRLNIAAETNVKEDIFLRETKIVLLQKK